MELGRGGKVLHPITDAPRRSSLQERQQPSRRKRRPRTSRRRRSNRRRRCGGTRGVQCMEAGPKGVAVKSQKNGTSTSGSPSPPAGGPSSFMTHSPTLRARPRPTRPTQAGTASRAPGGGPHQTRDGAGPAWTPRPGMTHDPLMASPGPPRCSRAFAPCGRPPPSAGAPPLTACTAAMLPQPTRPALRRTSRELSRHAPLALFI